MTNNHFQDYRTLGMEPGCTWKELQTAYRRLVQATHPDRITSISDDKELAEEKLKNINRAFHKLSNYRRNHGVLPGFNKGADNPVSAASTSGPGSSDEDTRDDFPTAPWDTGSVEPQTAPEGLRNHRARLPTALLWGGIVVVTLLLGEQLWTTSNEESSSDQNAAQVSVGTLAAGNTVVPASVQGKFFTIGSSMGEVYEIQGVPSATEEGLWYFGSSKVHFRKGVVVSWDQDPSHPLKAVLSTDRMKSTASFFTVGSTKTDVRSAMGAPMIESENIWDYGNSKVYFRNGKVTGWENSTLRPLKLQH